MTRTTNQPQGLETLEGRICFAGTGTTPPPPPPPPMSILADVNGDKKADLITLAVQPASAATTTPSQPKWQLKIQLGKGDGTFAAAKAVDEPAQSPVSIAVGDLDGDGKTDIAILNRDPAKTTTSTSSTSSTQQTPPPPPKTSVFILKGDGAGGLIAPPAGTTAPKPIAMPDGLDTSSIAVADVNKDGLADLVAIGNLAAKPTSTTTAPPKPVVNLMTMLNTPTAKGQLQKPTLTATDAQPGAYQLTKAGDLDKNGSCDLVAFQTAPPPAPQQGGATGATTTGKAASTATTQPPPKNLLLILTGVSGVTTKAMANPLLPPPPTTSSSTASGTQQQPPPPVKTIGVADVDGDGVADLVGVGGKGVLVAKFDPTTLTFTKPAAATSTNPPANLAASQVLIGDLNGDGKADLLSLSDKGVSAGIASGAVTFSWSPVAK